MALSTSTGTKAATIHSSAMPSSASSFTLIPYGRFPLLTRAGCFLHSLQFVIHMSHAAVGNDKSSKAQSRASRECLLTWQKQLLKLQTSLRTLHSSSCDPQDTVTHLT